MTHQEKIQAIKDGTALHYDINNLTLLNEVLKEISNNKLLTTDGAYLYYSLYHGVWTFSDDTILESIPLSSFLDTPKMISVEAVREKINEMLQHYKDEGDSDNTRINERCIGSIRVCNQLLNFLTQESC